MLNPPQTDRHPTFRTPKDLSLDVAILQCCGFLLLENNGTGRIKSFSRVKTGQPPFMGGRSKGIQSLEKTGPRNNKREEVALFPLGDAMLVILKL